METERKIYVAGDRIISAIGFSTAENMEAIRQGRTGIVRQEDPRLYGTAFPAARIDRRRLEEAVAAAGIEAYSRLEQLFILTVTSLLQRTGFRLGAGECGLVIATTKGNIDRIGCPEAYLWQMARRIGNYLGMTECPTVISNACISGVSALIWASRMMEAGIYRHVIVAGGDLLTRFVVTGFYSFKSVSAQPCRPYDAARDGLSLGEACGAIALTTDRSAVREEQAVLLTGGGISNDANHISGPSRTGDGLAYAIRSALEEAGVNPAEVSCVNAHGTATLYNDEMEAKAMKLAGLDRTPLNSLKGYWGHTLGAAGVIESVACIEQLRRQQVWGTRGFSASGVSVPLSLSSEHRPMELRHCLKTASGFGGCNAAVLFSREAFAVGRRPERDIAPEIVRTCRIARGEVMVDGHPEVKATGPFGEFIRTAFKALGESYMKFYKMDDLSKLGYTAVSWLLRGIEAGGPATGILLANAAASLDTDRKHQEIIDREGEAAASPAVFVYTLPNVMMGEVCIRYKIQGENTFFIREQASPEMLKEYAGLLMKKHKLNTCICGWCELDGEHYEADVVLYRN